MGACHGLQGDLDALVAAGEKGGLNQSCGGCCAAGSGLGSACSSATLSCKYPQEIELDSCSPVKDSHGEVLHGAWNGGRARRRSTPAAVTGGRGAFAISDGDDEVEVGVQRFLAAAPVSHPRLNGAFPASAAEAPAATSVLEVSPRKPPLDKALNAEGQDKNWHGPGVLDWPDGRRYVGQFFHGVFDGQATMEWPDGRRYVGQYRMNKKHGDGEFLWPDGRRYCGEWSNGQRHGRGMYTNAKGEQRCGRWSQDRPVFWEDAAPLEKGEEYLPVQAWKTEDTKAAPRHDCGPSERMVVALGGA